MKATFSQRIANMMKTIGLASSVLALSLTFAAPSGVFAHIGHGDEFQAEGGIDRVAVNAETDEMLGIVVDPITANPEGNGGVYVPVTALVEADGKSLVFVRYESFYEPVFVTTGETQGELIAVTEGLSVGEELVTQGSLSLYAESRKTQTATTPEVEETEADAIAPEDTTIIAENPAQTEAQSLPESNKGNFPIVKAAIGGLGGVVLLGGVVIVGLRAVNFSKKGKNIFGK